MCATPVERVPANSRWFREVLGQYPTGVCVVTAMEPGGAPAGMAVGSFSSASLSPPLVAFFPDRASTSWPRIRATGKFCVNILAAEQESVCRRLSSKGGNKFEALPYRLSPGGAPIIESCVAWIDCDIHATQDAGDHEVVLGLVRELQIESGGLPLIFFQGGYGRFMPLSLVALDPLDAITGQLRHVDAARPEMERLADALAGQCIATVKVERELIIAASAGHSRSGTPSALVGQRLPFMPPTGSVFSAWGSDEATVSWLRDVADLRQREAFAESLRMVRARGYSIGLVSEAQRAFVATLEERSAAARNSGQGNAQLRELMQSLSYDPVQMSSSVEKAIRLVSAPIFGLQGEPVLSLTIYGFRRPDIQTGIRHYIYALLEAAARITERIGGAPPSL